MAMRIEGSDVLVICPGKKVSRWSDVRGMDSYECIEIGSTNADQI